MRKVVTLAIVQNGDKTLLAMKKIGFCEGYWNGYGGKVEKGESIEQAMIRELWEESGVVAKKYYECGVAEFIFEGKDLEVEMHVFKVLEYGGQPVETDEMSLPQWFERQNIPYDKMWPADKDWLELFFDGKDFSGRAVFDGDTNALISSDFKIK
jgi:ADP-ribose pyrophosphatase YjhB (NUDIX family)